MVESLTCLLYTNKGLSINEFKKVDQSRQFKKIVVNEIVGLLKVNLYLYEVMFQSLVVMKELVKNGLSVHVTNIKMLRMTLVVKNVI